MTETKTKKGGGGKLNRTQTVTLRMDPKLRYLTDLAARTQRRTTSGFIEWAIERALKEVDLDYDNPNSTSIADEASKLWDVDEPDRFVKLAINYPNLLNHDEQVLWKLITSNLAFWNVSDKHDSNRPFIAEHTLNINYLHNHWDALISIVGGDIERMSELPDSEIGGDTNLIIWE